MHNLSSLIDQIGNGVLKTDERLTILYANQWFEDHIALHADTLIGKNIIAVFDIDEQRQTLLKRHVSFSLASGNKSFLSAKQGRSILNLPIIHFGVTKFNTMQEDITIIPERNEQCVWIVITDKTLEMQTAAEHLEEHEKFKTFAENFPGSIIIKDEALAIKYANPYVTKLFDKSIIGRKHESLFHDPYSEKTKAVEQRVLKGNNTQNIETYTLNDKTTTFQTYRFLIEHNNIKELGVLGVDITELERLQNRLEEQVVSEVKKRYHSEKRYVQLFENIEECIFVFTLNEDNTLGNIVEANPYTLKTLEYSFEEILHLKPSDLVTLDNPLQYEMMMDSLLSNSQLIVDIPFKTKEGSLIMMHTNIHLVNSEDGKVCYVTARDISDELALKHASKEQEAMLIQQSKLAAMGEMIGAISHQWRQPLNALALLVQTLLDDYELGSLDEVLLNDRVSKSMHYIQHMSETIDDFRNFFSPTNRSETFIIKECIDEVYAIYAAQLKHSGISYNYLSNNNACSYYGNKNQLKQVLLNLFGNAIDAIKERLAFEDNRYTPNIVFECYNSESLITLKLQDNGIGVDDSNRLRVFEPYFTTKGTGKGTGIGLYMSKTIVEKSFHGTIETLKLNEGFGIEIIFSERRDENANCTA